MKGESSYFPGLARNNQTYAAFCSSQFFSPVLQGSIFAPDPTSYISQYGHSAWRLQDGYFGGTPTAITQTADGYIWAGRRNDGCALMDSKRAILFQPFQFFATRFGETPQRIDCIAP